MIQFKQFKESLITVQGVNEDNNLETLIPEVMNVISQIHVWHLVCPSGQKHTALGEFYDEMQDGVDELAETYIAIGGEIETTIPFTASVDYSESAIIKYVKTFRERISECVDSTEGPEFKSLQDKVIDLQEMIDTFLFRFNLS